MNELQLPKPTPTHTRRSQRGPSRPHCSREMRHPRTVAGKPMAAASCRVAFLRRGQEGHHLFPHHRQPQQPDLEDASLLPSHPSRVATAIDAGDSAHQEAPHQHQCQSSGMDRYQRRASPPQAKATDQQRRGRRKHCYGVGSRAGLPTHPFDSDAERIGYGRAAFLRP